MNILIIEDEELSADRLQDNLIQIDPSIHVLAKIASVKDALLYLTNTSNTQPDLIFLDIHLEDDLGFKIIEILDLITPVIFTTAYNDYLQKAFQTNSIQYLLKPIDIFELKDALIKYRKVTSWHHEEKVCKIKEIFGKPDPFKDRFLASIGNKLLTIAVDDIAYFLVENKATYIKTYDDRRYIIDYSLEKIEQMVDPTIFYRVNRYLIVSIKSIKHINSSELRKLTLELTPPISHPVIVSGDRMASFKLWLGK